MNKLSLTTVLTLLLILLPAARATTPEADTSLSKKERLVIILVRHGEKTDASRDPQLSTAGQQRARLLANTLRDAGISHVHSSDFIRTRDTAAPTAKNLGIEVELYDHDKLPALAQKLRQTGGRHLVVGHSDTTPAMVELLGSDPGAEIDEASEYDRLYIVTITSQGASSSVMLRYGEP